MNKRHYQERDHAPRALAERLEPRLAREFAEGLRHARAIVPVRRVAQLLAQGRRAAAVDAIDWRHLREALKEPFDGIARAVEAGGRLGEVEVNRSFRSRNAKPRYGRFHNRRRHRPRSTLFSKIMAMPSDPLERLLVHKAVGNRFDFDRFDDATRDIIRDYQDKLIRELERKSRESINSAIQFGVQQAMSPDTIASSIRDSISLTDRQAQAVANFRNLIEQGDPATLDRALRDRSYDNVLEDLIDGGGASDAVIDAMVEAYAENYLDHRAQTIARTESLRASNLGLRESYRQAADRGVIPEGAVKRVWLVALDEKTCPICLSIPELNPDGVGLNEDFQSEDGPMDDPPIHPSCRCSVQYETNIDMIPEDEVDEAA